MLRPVRPFDALLLCRKTKNEHKHENGHPAKTAGGPANSDRPARLACFRRALSARSRAETSSSERDGTLPISRKSQHAGERCTCRKHRTRE